MLITALALLSSACAPAPLSDSQLRDVRAAPSPFARLPLDLTYTDEQGAARSIGALLAPGTTALVFVDYRCRNLCGVGLPLLADALAASKIPPCRIVAIGLDPTETPADATAFRRRHLTGTDCTIALLTSDRRSID